MRALIVAGMFVLALGACGGFDDGGDGEDECDTSIDISPALPQVGMPVRATALVNISGPAEFSWEVTFGGQDVPFAVVTGSDGAIEFVPTQDGSYTVSVDVELFGETCLGAMRTVQVGISDAAGEIVFRRGDDFAPKVYALDIVPGADKSLGTLQLDPGRTFVGQVSIGAVGEPAFLRFPAGLAVPGTPVIEAFTDASGNFSVPIGTDTNQVIVVPATAGMPWGKFPTTSGDMTLTDGMELSGTVRGPSGAALAGARVQIVDPDGVASTVGITDGNGAFAIELAPTSFLDGSITVTPPAGSGLPTLTLAGSATYANPIDVSYSPSLVLRNAGGTQVTRAGTLANAQVTIVGTIAQAGTVTASGGSVPLTGTVRIATTTTGAGALPALQVPAANLSAVVSPSAGDYAVAPFDTTSAVPASITAPAMIAFSTRLEGADASDLPGAELALEPTGALALAGIPSVVVVADGNALAAGVVAAGGTYQLRASDPEGRAGLFIETIESAADIGSVWTFPTAVKVTGTLTEFGGQARVPGALVEIYCAGCSKDPSAAPLGQALTDAQGRFVLTVTSPDPE